MNKIQIDNTLSEVDAKRNYIIELLKSRKAQDLLVFDVREKPIMTTYVILATGTSNRHISSIANFLCQELKHNLNCYTTKEGFRVSNWVSIDAKDIIVHLFSEESRDYFKLEELYKS
ncbi:MAG: ribosome silencing factor [Rickettsiaceae bacterium]|nr:ribosome silencing factor [Rickettsiaceae bacterium]